MQLSWHLLLIERGIVALFVVLVFLSLYWWVICRLNGIRWTLRRALTDDRLMQGRAGFYRLLPGTFMGLMLQAALFHHWYPTSYDKDISVWLVWKVPVLLLLSGLFAATTVLGANAKAQGIRFSRPGELGRPPAGTPDSAGGPG